jgi:hypothetical protein
MCVFILTIFKSDSAFRARHIRKAMGREQPRRDRVTNARLPGAGDAGLTKRMKEADSSWSQQTSPRSRERVVNPSKESSTMHAIRKLRESGHATAADYEKILAANVVFHSPVLVRTVEGRTVVAKIFAASTTLREGAYTGEWKLDDRRTLLRWKGEIQGHELESLDITGTRPRQSS